MTPEEESALRDELRAVKAANAFLYLALETVGKLSFEVPKSIGLGLMNSPDKESVLAEIKKLSVELSENLSKAHQCIWDENGKPR